MFSDPVSGDKFFDRTETLSTLTKRVDGLKEGYRQNVAIIGRQLLGKTSILHHFLLSFRDNQIIPIYLEVKPEPFGCFANRFMAILLYQFLKSKSSSNIDENLDSLIKESRNFIPETVRAIEKITCLIKKGKFNDAYPLLLDLISTLRSETEKLFVIIFDEFHLFGNFKIDNPFSSIGKRIMVQKDTMYILASSRVRESREILAEKFSLLFSNFEIIELHPFNFKTSSKFLDVRFEGIDVPIELKNFLIAFTDGHPFYLDVLALELKELTKISHQKTVSQSLMIEAINSLLFVSGGIINQYLMNSLGCILSDNPNSFTAISILLRIAQNKNRPRDISGSLSKDIKNISNQIALLVEKDFISKNGSFYTFTDRLFEFWLSSVYQIKQISLTTDMTDKSKNFKIEIEKMISNFASESKKAVYERIVELFRAFGNEVVEIERKRHKLPVFEEVKTIPINGQNNYILARKNDKPWTCAVSEKEISETEVGQFTCESRKIKPKVQRKILISLDGMEMNARLLAKEEKIWIWDIKSLNLLLSLYGKYQIVK